MANELPRLWYGTAWKELRTEPLTAAALRAGFRAIDTANQRKHYFEAQVGAAVAASGIPRLQLFLQSKFTHRPGQDHRLPYDPDASVTDQVRQSFASTLEHLQTTYLDSLLLHGPSTYHGLAPEDVEAWRAMEGLARSGAVRGIGISNVSADQLAQLCDLAEVPPTFVQNRCYARTGWDALVRSLCARKGIRYQGFSLLTANQRELASPTVDNILRRVGGTRAQLVFRFATAVGMIALTGTSSTDHMRDDLAIDQFPPLSEEDIQKMQKLALSE